MLVNGGKVHAGTLPARRASPCGACRPACRWTPTIGPSPEPGDEGRQRSRIDHPKLAQCADAAAPCQIFVVYWYSLQFRKPGGNSRMTQEDRLRPSLLATAAAVAFALAACSKTAQNDAAAGSHAATAADSSGEASASAASDAAAGPQAAAEQARAASLDAAARAGAAAGRAAENTATAADSSSGAAFDAAARAGAAAGKAAP